MTIGSVNVFDVIDGVTLKDIYKANLEHAKRILLEDTAPGDFEELVTFSPTLFLITKKRVYYILLDTKFAEERKESPLQQVVPIVSQFIAYDDQYGELLAYQTVAEAWAADGKVPKNYKHGDIQKLATRKEVLINVIQEKGKKPWSSTFEIIREINSNKVTELKLLTEGSCKTSDLPRTPGIPTDPKTIKMIKDGIHKMMDEIKNNPDTDLGFHVLQEHTQDWKPGYVPLSERTTDKIKEFVEFTDALKNTKDDEDKR